METKCFLSVKVCEDLVISSSNVSEAGRTYGDVIYGQCDSGWQTPGGATYLSTRCTELGVWDPVHICQRMVL